jgi:hypothetical protein
MRRFWETQGPSAALGITDLSGWNERGRSRLHLSSFARMDSRGGLSPREYRWRRHADRSVRATRSFAEKLSSPLYRSIPCISLIADPK